MIEKYLLPGLKIELRKRAKYSVEEDTPSKVHISQINDVLDDETIEVLMPIEHSKLTVLPIGAVYTVIVYSSHGVFQCDAKISARYKKNNLYLNELEIISDIKRYQRREYYRYTCSIPVYTRLLSEDELEKRIWDVNKEGIEGFTLDLGGGGIRFISDEDYQPEDMILCTLHLQIGEEVETFQIMGKVLSTVVTGKYENKLEVRVQFEEVSDRTREQIIQFIFEDERRQRRKGKRR